MNQVNKLLGSIWIMKETCIQTLHHILNLSHNAHFRKSLDYKINAVAHIMHTNMNGAFSSFNWTMITPILMPWNTFTPSIPNVISLDEIVS